FAPSPKPRETGPPARPRSGSRHPGRSRAPRRAAVPSGHSSRRRASQDEVTSVTKPNKPDPAVEGFLALATARLAPRTVEAYRRDLAHLTAWLGRSPAHASPDDLATHVAQLP